MTTRIILAVKCHCWCFYWPLPLNRKKCKQLPHMHRQARHCHLYSTFPNPRKQ